MMKRSTGMAMLLLGAGLWGCGDGANGTLGGTDTGTALPDTDSVRETGTGTVSDTGPPADTETESDLLGDSETDEETDGADTETQGAAIEDSETDTAAGEETDPDTGTVDATGGTRFTAAYQRADALHPNAPGTIFIVTFTVTLPSVESAVIRFGPDTGYGMTAPVTLDGEENRTLLLGMNPSSTYHFQVAAVSSGEEYLSEDYEIETGPATNLVSLDEFDIVDPVAHEPGYIVAAVGRTVIIIGPDGALVWWYRSTIADVIAARMSYDGQSMWVLPRLSDPAAEETGPLERVSMDTLEAQIYDDTASSHDITPVSGETMAFINYGFDGDCSDSVLEIDNSGATREVFRAWDYLDDCHINAIRYNETEDRFTISDRSSTIFVADRDGVVEWRLSDVVSNADYGAIQHGHHLVEESLILFANHAERQRSLVLGFDRTTGDTVYVYDGDEYSNTLGTVQRLPGGNTLATYSNAGAIHEADPEGNTVMTLQTDPIGYTSWRASMYGPPSDVQTW